MNQSQLTGYNRGKTKAVDFERALFAYTEKQVGGQITHPSYCCQCLQPLSYFTMI